MGRNSREENSKTSNKNNENHITSICGNYIYYILACIYNRRHIYCFVFHKGQETLKTMQAVAVALGCILGSEKIYLLVKTPCTSDIGFGGAKMDFT